MTEDPMHLPEEHLAAIQAAYSNQFGGLPRVIMHEIQSQHVHLDAYVYPDREDRPFITVATMGMSARPMLQGDSEFPCRSELIMYLPADWDFGSDLGRWPIGRLLDAARFPFKFSEVIGTDHSLEWEDRPIIPGSLLCGFYFRPCEGDFYSEIILADGTHVHPLWAVDMTQPELYQLRQQGPYVMDALIGDKHPMTLDIDRPCMVSEENRAQRRARERAQKIRRRLPREMPVEALRCALHPEGCPTHGE